MREFMVWETEIEADGQRTLELPQEMPRGRVRVTIEALMQSPPVTVDDSAIDAELETLLNDPTTFTGLGLTMGEILQSPAIGMWANRDEMADPVAYLANQRRLRTERKLSDQHD